MAIDFTTEGDAINVHWWNRVLTGAEISFLVVNPDWPFTICVDPVSSLISERLKEGYLG